LNEVKELDELREKIEDLDMQIIDLIDKRMSVVEEIAKVKRNEGLPIMDEEREEELASKIAHFATDKKMDVGQLKEMFNIMIEMSINRQKNIIGEGDLIH